MIRDPSNGTVYEPPKPTIEELKAKYGPNWGLGDIPKSADEPPRQAPGWNSIVAMYGSDPSLLNRLLLAASPAKSPENVG